MSDARRLEQMSRIFVCPCRGLVIVSHGLQRGYERAALAFIEEMSGD
ncbi:MAG: hypothetical protein KJO60_03825 [Desulfofustis sp.]|nr:hypothetical protein [Desulfofustis sp.]